MTGNSKGGGRTPRQAAGGKRPQAARKPASGAKRPPAKGSGQGSGQGRGQGRGQVVRVSYETKQKKPRTDDFNAFSGAPRKRSAAAVSAPRTKLLGGSRKTRKNKKGGIQSVFGKFFSQTFSGITNTLRDRTRKFDKPLLWIIILMVVVGLIMLYSASYTYAYYHEKGDSAFYAAKQFKFAVVGTLIMLATSFIPMKTIRMLNLPINILSFILLVVVLFTKEIEFVHRWIDLGFTTFQPSEITKLGVILFCSTWADSKYDRMNKFLTGALPFAIMLLVVCGLLVLEPHLSCIVLILLITLTIMFVGGTKLWHMLTMCAAGAAGVVLAIVTKIVPYSGGRIDAWLHPFENAKDAGWQTLQSLYAIGSGGLLGMGLGNSRQKNLYIPEPQNDFVFAVVCEELGFIGAVLILALFAAFVWRGLTLSASNPNRFSRFVGIGITAQIGWQALLNIAVVTNSVPNTGISLPFFSYGGTSMLMLLFEMGILLAISRDSTAKKI